MIAISAAAPSASSPPAAVPSKIGSGQTGAFLKFFGKQPDSATPTPPKKKADDSNQTGVIANVPTTLKTLLPITLPQVVEQASGGEAAETEPQTEKVEKLDAPRAEQAPQGAPGELAFAAKLVNNGPQQPAAPVPTGPAAKPTTPATLPANAANPLPQTATESNPIRPVASPSASADRRASTSQHSSETPQRSDEPTAPAKTTPQARVQIEASSVQAPTATAPAVVRDMNSSSVMSRTIEPAPAAQASESLTPIRGATEQTQTPARLQDISIRVAGPQQNSASIRLVDNAGELRVAVRSTDPQLADSLRANVDQLTSRLNNNGISAEVWRPSAVAAANRSESPSQNMSQDRQNSAAQQWRGSTRDQQNQNQQRPDWAEEFELWQ